MTAMIERLQSIRIAEHELWRVMLLFGSILVGWILGKVAQHLLLRAADRAHSGQRETAAVACRSITKPAVLLFVTVGVRQGLASLLIAERIAKLAGTATSVLIAFMIGSRDWWAFMAFQDKLHLDILRRFNEAGIEFAFATSTVHLVHEPGNA